MHVGHLLLLLALGFLLLTVGRFGYLLLVDENLLFVILPLGLCRSQIRAQGSLRIHMISIIGVLRFLLLVRGWILRLINIISGVKVGPV